MGKSMSVPLCRIACCTSIKSDKDVRLLCLKFIRGTEAPVVGGRQAVAAMDFSTGYVIEMVLRDDQDKTTMRTAKAPAGAKVEEVRTVCTCEACQRSLGGDISGDEFAYGGAARTGRRKTRKGMRASRLQHISLCMGSCENDQ